MDGILWMQQRSVAVVTLVFLLIVAASYWPGRKSALERHGQIPLDDDA